MLRQCQPLSALITALAFAVCPPCCAQDFDQEPARQAPGKTLTQAAPDLARIVVFRDASIEAGITTTVLLDNGLSARLAPLGFASFDVKPGPHAVRSDPSASDALTLHLDGGSTTYLWQRVRMGALWGEASLHLVDEVSALSGMQPGRRTLSP